MKKFALALVALLALSFTFMSCDAPADKVLEVDDVTADLVAGTWSGTTVIAEYDGDGTELVKTTNTFSGDKMTVEQLKAIILVEDTDIMIAGTGVKSSSVVKSNRKGTKLHIEVTTESFLANKSVGKVVAITDAEKD